MPESPTIPRRRNVVKVELTDDELAMAKVTGTAPEAFVRTAVELHMAALKAKLAELIKPA